MSLSCPQFPIVSHNTLSSASELREQFVEGFADLANGSRTLRQVVPACIGGAGFSRKELVLWGVEAGHSASHVRSVIRRILCRSGVRQRKRGAGRRIKPKILAILYIRA